MCPKKYKHKNNNLKDINFGIRIALIKNCNEEVGKRA